MTTKREQVLSALYVRLGGLTGNVAVLRNAPLPERVPQDGLVILRDGNPGEPEVTLSPLRYHWEHRAEVEVFLRDKSDLDGSFDDLVGRIGTALGGDRTLGGLCDWVEPEAPAPADLAVEGAPQIKAAVLTIVLYYDSTDPLA